MKRSIFFLFVVLLVSCNEDDVSPTQAQVTAKRLVNELGISFDTPTANFAVTVSNIDTASTLFTGTSLKITSDGFAEVANEGQSSAVLNLKFLKSYSVSGSNLWLFF